MKSLKPLFIAAPIAACIFAMPILAEDSQAESRNSSYGRDRSHAQSFVVRGRVTTGYNMQKGKVMYDLGGIVGAQGFHYVFAYAPGSSRPGLITEMTPMNTVLATGVDEGFYYAVGIDPNVIDPNAINLPLRDLPITVDGNTADEEKAKAKLAPITSENYKTAFTQAIPSKALTVADWFSARGKAYVRCESSGRARTVLSFENMVPNGVYAVWMIIGEDKNQDGLRDFFSPKPFGGHPNVFTADDRGNATFARDMPFCPSTDPDMMTVEITYHVDGVTYGAVPSISPVVSNGNSYLATPTHMSFNLGGLKEAS